MSTILPHPTVPAHPKPASAVKVQPRQRPWTLLRLLLLTALLVAAWGWQPATAFAEEGVYVVKRGDTLAAIAQRFNISPRDLAANNGVLNPNIIYVGQRLVIPGSPADSQHRVASPAEMPAGDGYYTVQRGDTLAQIAQNHGMVVGDILRLNGLTNPNFIWVGQKLRISARANPVPSEKAAKPAVADAIHVVRAGETLGSIASEYNTTIYDLMAINGLPNPNFVWVGQRLRVVKPKTPEIRSVQQAPAGGLRWIEVNLSNQTLTAWQGDVPVLHTSVSTGTAAHPTVTGRFPIYLKYSSQRMTGPGYDLPGVPWVMYFFSGYAIHGTYWHNNFGTPMSHGCVNMRTEEARFLYEWASEGTEVYVHY